MGADKPFNSRQEKVRKASIDDVIMMMIILLWLQCEEAWFGGRDDDKLEWPYMGHYYSYVGMYLLDFGMSSRMRILDWVCLLPTGYNICPMYIKCMHVLYFGLYCVDLNCPREL